MELGFDRVFSACAWFRARHKDGDRKSQAGPAEVRRQPGQDLEMIQLQLDDRDVSGKMPPHITRADILPADTRGPCFVL